MTSAISLALDYDRLAASARNGGFTVALDGRQPTSGYAFSPYPERSYTIPTDAFTASDVSNYEVKNADLLSRPDHYLGAWEDNGRVWLDVSIIAPDLGAAETLGRAYGQLAVYDLAAGQEITL